MKKALVLLLLVLSLFSNIITYAEKTGSNVDHNEASQLAIQMSTAEQEKMIGIGTKMANNVRILLDQYRDELQLREQLFCLLLNDRLNALHVDDDWEALEDDINSVKTIEDFRCIINGDYYGITLVSKAMPQKSVAEEEVKSLLAFSKQSTPYSTFAIIAYPYYSPNDLVWLGLAVNDAGEYLTVELSADLTVLSLNSYDSNFLVESVSMNNEAQQQVVDATTDFYQNIAHSSDEVMCIPDLTLYSINNDVHVGKVLIYTDIENTNVDQSYADAEVLIGLENSIIYSYRRYFHVLESKMIEIGIINANYSDSFFQVDINILPMDGYELSEISLSPSISSISSEDKFIIECNAALVDATDEQNILIENMIQNVKSDNGMFMFSFSGRLPQKELPQKARIIIQCSVLDEDSNLVETKLHEAVIQRESADNQSEKQNIEFAINRKGNEVTVNHLLVNHTSEQMYIELTYQQNNISKRYTVDLVNPADDFGRSCMFSWLEQNFDPLKMTFTLTGLFYVSEEFPKEIIIIFAEDESAFILDTETETTVVCSAQLYLNDDDIPRVCYHIDYSAAQ